MLMPPQLKPSASQPDYLRIYQYYREQILHGTLPEHAKLPSIRVLARHLGLSRNPVEAAYASLVAEGYLANKPKSGYYAAFVPQLAQSQRPPRGPADERAYDAPGGSADSQPQESLRPHASLPQHGNEGMPPVDFAYDRIQPGFFPLNVWKKLSQRTLREAGPELFDYGDRQGEPGLRRLIRNYVSQNRGVVCEPDQIIVTAGTQQSALLIGLLLRSGQRPLGVEEAMHPGMYRMFERLLPGPVPIPLEQDGISVAALAQAEPLCGVYVTPSHQFPYGGIMPAAKRVRLLEWAASAQAWIIEDDYDSEFIYDGRPLPALQGMDRGGRVIYAGTFSKALAPALRLSYVILPPELHARYKEAFPFYDGTVSRLTQLVMERFMDEGHLDRHIRKMRTIYNTNRKALLAAIASQFGAHADVFGASSGLHVRLAVRTEHDARTLAELARRAGIGLRQITDYHVGIDKDETDAAGCREADIGHNGDRGQFVLGYGGLTANQLEDGVRRLAEAWGIQGKDVTA
ncbi:PLP-dependent aminotransferase family protein [Paenibacillus lycopersici]|uniref:PLP-dependent aminotransferase family protein n=1 Tax=Paenibacillus lycopersici TaxID=2704462 RepID=A0A6C0G2X0_9BACL|nr:PLP-dependent aminotransferase family protein [Paenibacillus lycopersici]QHT62313.1 PLP-dependent aminotransferase family protein [Paenibacillus lycopersici]